MCRHVRMPDGSVAIVCFRGDHKRPSKRRKTVNPTHAATPWDEYADLDNFGREAAPQRQFAAGLESIPDGDHQFKVERAIMDKINQNTVIRTELRALSAGGRCVEYIWWLNRQPSVNACLADFALLGFSAQNWGSKPGQVPLSQAIPQAVRELNGVTFRAVKATRTSRAEPPLPGQQPKEPPVYRDLHIAGRLGTAAPMPSVAGTQVAQAPAGHAVVQPAQSGSFSPTQQAASASAGYDDIPF